MAFEFERTPLWRRTLGECPDDPACEPRQRLRIAYLGFRAAVEPLAAEIARSLPMFTDHSIAHIDALWDSASLVCGDDFPLNPAEAFVLGGAFLLHDLGMGLSSYRGGITDLERDARFGDLLAAAVVRLRRTDPSTSTREIGDAARNASAAELLRLRHAAQAETLVIAPFQTSSNETFYLLQDAFLRQTFGSLIGRIAHSHWWDVADLRKFERVQGSSVDHPREWEVDPLKVACVLRLADAAQIDQRRAPTYLHAFRRPEPRSHDHWYFQEQLTRPRLAGDRLEFTATRPFTRNESSAWWLAWETVQQINEQLRQVDAICADLGRPRFAARSVAGADSPERLALYIRTEGWDPVDARLRVTGARELIANLGGEDLYGRKPEVAVRELIANGADATRALAAFKGDGFIPDGVTVHLYQEDGSWWLSVEDHGIGMKPETMVAALTDFGYTRWVSPEMTAEFPGLLSSGFQPTGRFGIGFFAVFMIADDVDVFSLAYDEAPRSTHVLEFRNGVSSRPLLREADVHERLKGSGTLVRAKLRYDPISMDGLFKTTARTLNHTDLLHSRLTCMCALAEVDIRVQGPDDQHSVRIIQANDWSRIPLQELFGRLYRKDEASYSERVLYEGFEKIFIDRATDLLDEKGYIIGRAMMVTGSELMSTGFRTLEPPNGLIYVGGLQADKMYYCMGAFRGRPLTADRLKAWPTVSIQEFSSWVEVQAEKVARSPWRPFVTYYMGFICRSFGAMAPDLVCAIGSGASLDRRGLTEWLAIHEEIFILSDDSVAWLHKPSGKTLLFTSDGDSIDLPANYLVITINPLWSLPEEVLERPKDPRFADVSQSTSRWDLRAWWYDSGNFGSPGLVVRTIAEQWGISVVDAVNLMEPLHMEDGRDLRPEIKTADGGSIRMTAIRMRRPRAGSA